MEKVGNLWCIFKSDKNYEYWLDINKKWSSKNNRAGIKDFKKAQKLLIKIIGENRCLIN